MKNICFGVFYHPLKFSQHYALIQTYTHICSTYLLREILYYILLCDLIFNLPSTYYDINLSIMHVNSEKKSCLQTLYRVIKKWEQCKRIQNVLFFSVIPS